MGDFYLKSGYYSFITSTFRLVIIDLDTDREVGVPLNKEGINTDKEGAFSLIKKVESYGFIFTEVKYYDHGMAWECVKQGDSLLEKNKI